MQKVPSKKTSSKSRFCLNQKILLHHLTFASLRSLSALLPPRFTPLQWHVDALSAEHGVHDSMRRAPGGPPLWFPSVRAVAVSAGAGGGGRDARGGSAGGATSPLVHVPPPMHAYSEVQPWVGGPTSGEGGGVD